jgi:alpha-amylase/alpha-mannosidase (GH57 family)
MPKQSSPRTNSASTSAPSAAPSAPASTRFVCIHGHFYQPPRENPWLEVVEVQDSAAPYHDWNDRITAECYAPNGASRITNQQNEIVRIVNNYARMSYNFGPTLLKWMEDNARRTYRMVVDADRASAERYSGHGSAIAQVYNHIIMPLASERDARTQIRWGIADFEYRFGRRPEGMWLAETAVSRSVLDLMAAEGIKFTILAPHQCARVRPLPTNNQQLTTNNWSETPNATVDTTHPYLVRLDEGRSIAVFFYDGPTSRAIAFEGLLNSGEEFAQRLLAPFQPGASSTNNEHRTTDNSPRLSHVATDGESYGHHHRYGEMALSYAMHLIESGTVPTASAPTDAEPVRLTNYAEFLARFPPTHEAEVADDTSWSCSHGVERWRSDCGCNGGRAGWNQQWRGPLREALDYLRDSTAPLAEALARPLLRDLWSARDAYISVMLDRIANTGAFFARHATHTLTPAERVTALELMELERHTQLMYTSCGWFFDEVSGIETIQVIAYAGRVIQLAQKPFGPAGAALEDKFLEILSRAKSNLPEFGDAAELYRRYVLGLRVGLEQVGAHYAISSIFRTYPEDGDLFCYTVHRDALESFASGRGRVALGRARIRSRITEEAEDISFAVLHLGDQNLSAAVGRFNSADPDAVAAFASLSTAVPAAIGRADIPEVIRLIDRFFGGIPYSLTSLFADEQHRILRTILDRTLDEMEDSLRKIYEDHASLLRFLTDSGMAAPPALAVAANYALNAALRRAIEADDFNPSELTALFSRASAYQVTLDTEALSFAAAARIKRALVALEMQLDIYNDALSKVPPSLPFTPLAASAPPFASPIPPAPTESSSLSAPIGPSASLIPGAPQDAVILSEGASATESKDPEGAGTATARTVPTPTSGTPFMRDPQSTHGWDQNANGTTGSLSIPARNVAATLRTALTIAAFLRTLPFNVNLWQAQNIWNDLLRRNHLSTWPDDFKKLGQALYISVDSLVTESSVPTF